MTLFNWLGGSVAKDQGRYQVAADWFDAGTGTSGTAAPASGDVAQINGVRNAGIHRLGALYVFPDGGGYTQVLFYAPPTPDQLQKDPNSIVGDTVASQTINVVGKAGPVSLWLQNSQFVDDTINVTGKALFQSYLDSSVSGTIGMARPAWAPGFCR